jgi:hypothetical protein
VASQLTGDDEKQSRSAKHFEDRYWIDVVRGLNPGHYEVEMQQHLDTGCEVCLRDRDLWLGLVDTSKDDGLYEPSEETIRRVKSLLNKREAVTLYLPKDLKLFSIFRIQVPVMN